MAHLRDRVSGAPAWVQRLQTAVNHVESALVVCVGVSVAFQVATESDECLMLQLRVDCVLLVAGLVVGSVWVLLASDRWFERADALRSLRDSLRRAYATRDFQHLLNAQNDNPGLYLSQPLFDFEEPCFARYLLVRGGRQRFNSSCVLCLEEFSGADWDQGLTQLGCQHLFHLDCVLPWAKRNFACPICKASPRTEMFDRFCKAHGGKGQLEWAPN